MRKCQPKNIPANCWQALIEHKKKISDSSLADMFMQDPKRAENFSTTFNGLFVDYSKNYFDQETLSLLFAMAQDINLATTIKSLFSGAIVNQTENSAAMHMALRAPADQPYFVDGENISKLIHTELQHMQEFISLLQANEIQGFSGKAVKTIINIGIGGSYFGAKLVTQALADFSVTNIEVHFVSNIDTQDIQSALAKSDPSTTLFIIASKSFTTLETLHNTEIACNWLRKNGCHEPEKQLIAITANDAAAKTLGIRDEHIFHIWQWIGGRYSIWSAMGLPVAIKIGMKNFCAFLSGAYAVDQHFLTAPLEHNLPVILALIDIWYINFFHSRNFAIFPYDDSLNTLPAYIGQLFMESNGKQIDNDGNKIGYQTAPVVWGGLGANAQHSFLQALHQGTIFSPVDFIVSLQPATEKNAADNHAMIANCLAQSATLMNGNMDQGTAPAYKDVIGNKPSTTILMDKLCPTSLGSLLCLYEHRCFVQSCVWNINPFDQWGVECSKTLSQEITHALMENKFSSTYDLSTKKMLAYYLGKTQS
ncbi:Glucose-6-phosphate isomerase [uncultured Candidatus Thioglobus sp.]|nr:Glucose-6-phosphate isomerase [uncultured Candidatus Thioglobus sp.]